MSSTEVKEQIHKLLENAPEDVLAGILDYLEELLSNSGPDALRSVNLHRILHEDKELLDKLSK